MKLMGRGKPLPIFMFYTYIHYKADTNEPFYIGKGQGRRHLIKSKRNNHWNNVVRKHGFRSEILCEWDNERDALEHEKFLIQCYKDIGIPLVNMTDGGEGTSGWTPDESWRLKKSESQKKKFSQNINPLITEEAKAKRLLTIKGRKLADGHKQKISLSLLGNKYSSGRKLSNEHRMKISESLVGNKNNLGRRIPDETRKKISESLAGIKHSPETIAKQVEGRRLAREKKLRQLQKESS